jgi:alpha-tubulin suppressor-like RCC1 family protein
MRLRPIIVEGIVVEGFGEVHVRRVAAGEDVACAIGDDGELFAWGDGSGLILGHGNE